VGILIPPQRGELPADWPDFPWARFCVVRFGYSVPVPPANVVADNHLTSGMRAYEALRRLGYRRIGFVSGVEVTTRFRAGFLLKQTDDEDVVERLPLPGGLACRRAEVLDGWMEQWRPDVILSDIPEMRVLLERRGLRVPRDIGLAGFSVLDGKVDSGIDQNSEEIGRVAIEALTALLNRNQLGIPPITREILVESTWRKGSSVSPRPGS
jgi:DNA-binding LacI/PurR family transcriptional regulator